jgi:two-component system, OmpR family, sensor kinase
VIAALRRLKSRLALRIYLAGLAQLAAVVLGFVLLLRILSPHPPPKNPQPKGYREARFAVEGVVARLGNEADLARELDRVRESLDASIVIYDDAGRVVASTTPDVEALPQDALPAIGSRRPPPPRSALSELGLRRPSSRPPISDLVIAVQLPDGRAGRAVYTSIPAVPPGSPGPPDPPAWHVPLIIAFVLAAIGVSSLLTARSLAQPLARLSEAARAFGAGKRDARVGLARSDEIGDVAAAFNEMADRIADLLRAEKELLANVSHELRTPLARIRVALDIAAEGDADVARQSLGEIAEDLAELERLISDVLTAARLDLDGDGKASGIPPLRCERVDLGELLSRAASRFRSAHPKRALALDLAPDLPVIDGDPVLLRRVVDNLLDNAHKYSIGAEDTVELHAASVPGAVRIEIRDYGIGIAPEDLPRIFRPFFRVDRSRTRTTGGLGLGLALARRIVEAHRGTIEIESTIGEGTRARVHVPIAPAPPPAESSPDQATE